MIEEAFAAASKEPSDVRTEDRLVRRIDFPRYYTFDDYEGATARWCPGCGDHGVLTAVQRLCRDEQLPPEKTVFVSGIGCASRFPHYMNAYGFHGLHGRALPVACGIRARRPDLHVFVATGDGDCCSIGTAHWIHAIRYNMKMVVMLLDNNVYGLTKNQTSPTSTKGSTTPTPTRAAGCSIRSTRSRPRWASPTRPSWRRPSTGTPAPSLRHAHGRAPAPGARLRADPAALSALQGRLFDSLMSDPSKLLLMTHPDGIEVDDAVKRMFEEPARARPVRSGRGARACGLDEEGTPIGLFYRNDRGGSLRRVHRRGHRDLPRRQARSARDPARPLPDLTREGDPAWATGARSNPQAVAAPTRAVLTGAEAVAHRAHSRRRRARSRSGGGRGPGAGRRARGQRGSPRRGRLAGGRSSLRGMVSCVHHVTAAPGACIGGWQPSSSQRRPSQAGRRRLSRRAHPEPAPGAARAVLARPEARGRPRTGAAPRGSRASAKRLAEADSSQESARGSGPDRRAGTRGAGVEAGACTGRPGGAESWPHGDAEADLVLVAAGDGAAAARAAVRALAEAGVPARAAIVRLVRPFPTELAQKGSGRRAPRRCRLTRPMKRCTGLLAAVRSSTLATKAEDTRGHGCGVDRTDRLAARSPSRLRLRRLAARGIRGPAAFPPPGDHTGYVLG